MHNSILAAANTHIANYNVVAAFTYEAKDICKGQKSSKI